MASAADVVHAPLAGLRGQRGGVLDDLAAKLLCQVRCLAAGEEEPPGAPGRLGNLGGVFSRGPDEPGGAARLYPVAVLDLRGDASPRLGQSRFRPAKFVLGCVGDAQPVG